MELAKNSGFVVESVAKKETPIFGILFKKLYFPYVVSRLLSGLLFPFQKFLSKIFGASEALLIILKKNKE